VIFKKLLLSNFIVKQNILDKKLYAFLLEVQYLRI